MDKFITEDPYILSALMLTADNNSADLNVIIREQDGVQATSAFFRTQGLTSSIATPSATVALVAQQTIGAALGGIDQPIGGFDRCFLGHTMVSLFNGKQIPFSELYKKREERLSALSFDRDDRPVPGVIVDVGRYTTKEWVKITFSDGTSTEARPTHPYFTGEGYEAIGNLWRKTVMNQNNEPVTIINLEKRTGEVFTYNLSIKDYRNYCADGKRVSNLKPLPPEV